MSKQEQQTFVDEIRESSMVINTKNLADISSDTDDNKLFSCAIEARASYIISGDKQHVLSIPEHKDILTISPRTFVGTALLKIA